MHPVSPEPTLAPLFQIRRTPFFLRDRHDRALMPANPPYQFSYRFVLMQVIPRFRSFIHEGGARICVRASCGNRGIAGRDHSEIGADGADGLWIFVL